MKPTNSPAVAAGPALQLIRGFIFSIALWPFRDIFLNTKKGWLKLWVLLKDLFTTIPIKKQIAGYLEVLPQTGLFSLIVCYWYKKPKKAWQVISIILVSLILLMSLLGVMMAKP
jgi:hypothetical protein